MIFENKIITEKLIEWQSTGDTELQEEILKECKKLVEAIVSGYGHEAREDLIQASYAKLIYALDKYDPNRGTTLHTFFTTVIHNACRTFLKKESKHYGLDDVDDYDEILGDVYEYLDQPDITYLITYCRNRFSDLDYNLIDYCVLAILNHIMLNGLKTYKIFCTGLSKELKISLSTLDLMYKVVLIIIRYHHIEQVSFIVNENGNATSNLLFPEIDYILGNETANVLAIILKGITVKF